jgi:hypothetical protein
MVSDSARELRLRPADGCGLRLGLGGSLSKLAASAGLLGCPQIQARFIRVSFHGSFASGAFVVGVAGPAVLICVQQFYGCYSVAM